MRRLRTLMVAAAGCLMANTLPNAQGCAPQGVNRVTIGTTTYVCLVKNDAQVTVMQAPADRYSRFAVANSYANNTASCRQDLYHVESLGVRSSFRKRFCTDDGGYFPILTAIVNVDMGRVSNITWDDGCYFTDSSVPASVQACVSNAYAMGSPNATSGVAAPQQGQDTALTAASCSVPQPSAFCDLTVYVAWTGRDANGNYFGSAGRRMSVFRQYGLQPQFDAMVKFSQ